MQLIKQNDMDIKINKKEILSFLKRKKTAFCISVLNTVILLLLLYWHNNQTIFTFDSSLQHSITEVVKSWFGMERSEANDNVVFVNVAYDKQLVEIKDSFNLFPIGNIDITDRS
jgi:Trk-type K+ transport system membrane component